jgi:tellurite methyltransferase
VRRQITVFQRDDAGDWVAELDCLHRQHVRHRPPWQDRPWVETAEGRAGRIGREIDCPLCDRAELPDGLAVVRTAGPFDAAALPPALTREHRVAAGRWGLLRVLQGSAHFEMAGRMRILVAGDEQPIPPGVAHRVTPIGDARLEVDFLAR